MVSSYPGNIPSNVAKDAKYSVVHGNAGMEVRLIYRVGAGERELLTTSKHPELVEMVNRVKLSSAQSPGGVFYINEYQHVLVPAGGSYQYAGTYQRILEFDFNRQVLGPRPPAGLQPGEDWQGPHVGIRYALTADGSDVRYEVKTTTGPTSTNEKRFLLSAAVGRAGASKLASRLGQYKGQGGGRIYINEVREFFAPVGDDPRYIYLGPLGDDPWFPAPQLSAN